MVVPVLVFIALAAWGVSDPVGSSPDDDFHLSSIWCGAGERGDLCAAGDVAGKQRVPQGLLNAECFALGSSPTAACQPDLDSAGSQHLIEARTNVSGLYPPVFYAALSVFASHDIDLSVVVMRLVNSALFVVVSVLLFLLLPRRRRRTLILAWTLGLVPLGMSLIPSTNPSSWAIIGAGTMWLSLLGWFESTGRKRVGLAVLTIVSTLLAVGARADSSVYAIVAVAAVLLQTQRWRRADWTLPRLWLPGVVVLLSIGFYFTASQGSAAAGGLSGGAAPGRLSDLIVLLASNLLALPSLWAGVFGMASLGWFDTTMPSLVWIFMVVIVGAMVFWGIAAPRWRKGLALVGLTVVLTLLPLYLLEASGVRVGSQVQPRYLLPLIIVLLGFAMLDADSRPLRLSRVQLWGLGGVVAVANGVALLANLKRYTIGTGQPTLKLLHGADWWWPAGVPSPVIVVAIGGAAFAAALAILLSSEIMRVDRAVLSDARESLAEQEVELPA